jgi:hypothetical protein
MGILVPVSAELSGPAADVPAADEQPTSVITAAPARTARADLQLLMLMPRSVKMRVGAPCRDHGPKVMWRAA